LLILIFGAFAFEDIEALMALPTTAAKLLELELELEIPCIFKKKL